MPAYLEGAEGTLLFQDSSGYEQKMRSYFPVVSNSRELAVSGTKNYEIARIMGRGKTLLKAIIW